MNIPTSTWWIVLIAVGAAVVAISNIQYNRARDAENKKAKAVQVQQLLRKELEHNAQLIQQMRDSLKNNSVPVEAFDTTAWQTISGADLLLGLPNDDLANLLQAYRLLNRANDLHTKIMESFVGIASALGGVDKTRGIFMRELSSVLDQVEPLLLQLMQWAGEAK